MASAKFDYEKSRAELDSIVRQLESGSNSLEDSLKLWEKGEKLAAACQAWLDEINNKLEKTRAELGDSDEFDEDDEFEDEEEFEEEEEDDE